MPKPMKVEIQIHAQGTTREQNHSEVVRIIKEALEDTLSCDEELDRAIGCPDQHGVDVWTLYNPSSSTLVIDNVGLDSLEKQRKALNSIDLTQLKLDRHISQTQYDALLGIESMLGN